MIILLHIISNKELGKILTCETTLELAPEPTKHNKSKLKLQQEFMNEIIADEKHINDQIFWNCFNYQNPLFLTDSFIRAKQTKNEKLVNKINDELIELRKAIIRKNVLEIENIRHC